MATTKTKGEVKWVRVGTPHHMGGWHSETGQYNGDNEWVPDRKVYPAGRGEWYVKYRTARKPFGPFKTSKEARDAHGTYGT